MLAAIARLPVKKNEVIAVTTPAVKRHPIALTSERWVVSLTTTASSAMRSAAMRCGAVGITESVAGRAAVGNAGRTAETRCWTVARDASVYASVLALNSTQASMARLKSIILCVG